MAKKNSEYLLKLRSLHMQNRRKRFWFVDQYLAYKVSRVVLCVENYYSLSLSESPCAKGDLYILNLKKKAFQNLVQYVFVLFYRSVILSFNVF